MAETFSTKEKPFSKCFPICDSNKTSNEGEEKEAVKDSNGDDNDNENDDDNNNLTFAAVSSVSNKCRYACTVVGTLSVVANGIYMTAMQAFLTLVDIYG